MNDRCSGIVLARGTAAANWPFRLPGPSIVAGWPVQAHDSEKEDKVRSWFIWAENVLRLLGLLFIVWASNSHSY